MSHIFLFYYMGLMEICIIRRSDCLMRKSLGAFAFCPWALLSHAFYLRHDISLTCPFRPPLPA
jgi:hypothetical protein